MLIDAKSTILKSGDFIPAGEVSKLGGYSRTNPSVQPNKWKRNRSIFAIEHKGMTFSRYTRSIRTTITVRVKRSPKSLASSEIPRTAGAWRSGSRD